MSDHDVEIVRAGYEAFLRGDLEAAFSVFAPDIEVHDDPGVVGKRVYRGPDGFAEMMARTTEGFEDIKYFAEEFTDAGDCVLVAARRSGRGTMSGAPVEEHQYHVWELSEGRAVRFRSFLSKAGARRAAGLDAEKA